MRCPECDRNSGIYVTTCPRCLARYCLTLPTREMAKATADRHCAKHGLDREEVTRLAKEITAERMRQEAAR